MPYKSQLDKKCPAEDFTWTQELCQWRPTLPKRPPTLNNCLLFPLYVLHVCTLPACVPEERIPVT